MDTRTVVGILVVIVVLVITIKLFARIKHVTKRRVVIIGRKGTGKTKLFLGLIGKAHLYKTLPSIDANREIVSGHIFLVDTPGTDSFEKLPILQELKKTDRVLYVFKKRAEEAEKKIETCAPVIRIYTGDEEQWSGSIKYIRLDKDVNDISFSNLLD